MTDYSEYEKSLKDAIIGCKVPEIQAAVNKAHEAGMPATDIINAMGAGMSDVGVLFERGRLFLPHVLSAAAGMKNAMEILGPELEKNKDDSAKGAAVVMGTVEGDVHDIGKSICSTMLQCAGFEVHDLGSGRHGLRHQDSEGEGPPRPGHSHGRRSSRHTGLR